MVLKEKKINLVFSLTSIIIMAISLALINKQTVTATEIFQKLSQNYILENITVKNFLQRWQFFLQGVTENKNFNFNLISWSPDDHYLIYSQSNHDCKDQQRLVYEAKCNERWYVYDVIQHASQLINQSPSKENISIYGFSSDGTILYFNDGFLTYNLKTKEWKQQTSPADKIDIIAVKTEPTEPIQTNNGWCFEDDQKQLLCLAEAQASFTTQQLIANNKKALATVYHKGFGPQAIFIAHQNP